MNPITIPNITIPVIGLPTIGIPPVGFPSASDGGLVWPKGLKESIKAIYDPASQGMTNYDVIEAYIEDFTGWEYRDYRGTAKITNNAIVITNVVETNNIVEDVKEPYSDLTIRVTGVTEDKYLIVRQGRGRPETHIKKDSIYIFSNNNLYFGFAVNKTGDCNITITQLPTSILKDLSGNGNHAYLYGGKGKLNSGMGVYQEDFTAWKTYNRADVDITPNILHITKVGTSNAVFISNTFLNNRNIYKLDIKGITNQSLYIGNYASANSLIKITQDGLYEIDSTKFPDSDIYGIGFIDFIGDCDITITQIPDYPNQLCYDGKMYAVCYDFPILTDYTVMADRTWFIEQLSNWTGVLSSNAYSGYTEERGFIFEYNAETDKVQNNSFGANNLNTRHQDGISYMTKTSYNGNSINSGDLKGVDFLTIGAFVDKDTLKGSYNWKGCHGKIIIADRSFTEDEITWLKDNWKKI